MKLAKIISIALIVFSMASYSKEPEILWSNFDTSISTVLYTKLSSTGDTVITVERDFINFYNTSDFKLINKIKINSLKFSSAFVDDKFEQILPNQANFIFKLPYLIINNVIIDLTNQSITRYSDGIIYDLKLNPENNSVYYLSQKITTKKYIESRIQTLNLDSKQTEVLFLLDSDIEVIRNVVRTDESNYLLATNLGLWNYDNSTKLRNQINSSNFTQDMLKEFKSILLNDQIYFFNSQGYPKLYHYDKSSSNLIAENSINEIFNGMDSVNSIRTLQSSLNPAVIIVSFQQFEKNEQGKYDIIHRQCLYDVLQKTKIFENNLGELSSQINGSPYTYIIDFIEGSVIYYTHVKIRVNQKYTSELIKVDLASAEITYNASFNLNPYSLPKYSYPYLLIPNGNILDYYDIETGKITKADVFSKDIYRLFTPETMDQFIISFKDGNFTLSEDESFYDGLFLYDYSYFICKWITKDQTKILLSTLKGGDYIVDTRTLRKVHTLNNNIGPYVFFSDSLLFHLSDYVPFKSAMYPVVLNLNTFESKQYDVNINKVLNNYKSCNDKLYATLNDSYIVKLLFNDNKFDAEQVYNYTGTKLYSFTISENERFVALIYSDNSYRLRVVDLQKGETIYDEVINNSGILSDLNFIDNKNSIVYCESDNSKKESFLVKINFLSKNIAKSNIIPLCKFEDNVDNDFVKLLDIDSDNNRLVFHSGINGAIFYDYDFNELGIKSFSQNYDEGYLTDSLALVYKQQLFLWKLNITLSHLSSQWSFKIPKVNFITSYNHDDNTSKKLIQPDIVMEIIKNKTSNIFLVATSAVSLVSYIFDFDIFNKSYKVIKKLEPGLNFDNYKLSNDDSKLALFKSNKLQLLNTDDFSFFPQPTVGSLGFSSIDFVYNNNDYLMQSKDSLIYVSELVTGKLFEEKLIRQVSYFDRNVNTTVNINGKNQFITGHKDGYIRFWEKDKKEPTYQINLGAEIKDLLLAVNNSKLVATSALGYFACINLNDFGATSVENSSKMNSDNNIAIYPNPTNDFITITLSNKGLQPFATTDKVKIFDMLGIEVSSAGGGVNEVDGGGIKIDVSHLTAGVYFIRICDKVEKFVKM